MITVDAAAVSEGPDVDTLQILVEVELQVLEFPHSINSWLRFGRCR
jgi:hypothetical protein